MIGFKKKGNLPGFGLAFGFTVFYLGIVVMLPLSMLFLRASGMSWQAFQNVMLSPRTLAAFQLTFGASFVAGLINMIFGFLVAWVLVRYSVPGKKVIDAMVDLPFALPTAVAGIALTSLYAPNGWIGRLLDPLGVRAAFSPVGIVIALTFIGFPFVVRTVEPVLRDLERETEEAAASLGAGRWKTFTRVIFPTVFPALLTGGTLAFARALGEYGSVVFISGNMPMRTEIVPLLIMTKLEQYDYAAATAIAAVTLCISFTLLFAINSLQAWSRRYEKI